MLGHRAGMDVMLGFSAFQAFHRQLIVPPPAALVSCKHWLWVGEGIMMFLLITASRLKAGNGSGPSTETLRLSPSKT